MFAWWFWAILFSMAFAGYYGVNQQFKIKPEALVVWSGLGTTIIFAPTLFGITVPKDILFYVFAVLSGLTASFLDNRNFTLTSKYGAGVIARMSPLSVAFLCILWWIIMPSTFQNVYENKLVFAGVCLCLGLCIIAAMMMKKDDVSRDAIKEYSWVILTSAIYSLLVKKTMSHTSLPSQAMLFMIIEISISGTINALIGCKTLSTREFKKVVFSKTSLKAGLFIIFFISSLCLTRNRAMELASNPAYVDAIGRGAPFLWIFIFNKIKGVTDKTNMKAGILFVISAIGIILLSAI